MRDVETCRVSGSQVLVSEGRSDPTVPKGRELGRWEVGSLGGELGGVAMAGLRVGRGREESRVK